MSKKTILLVGPDGGIGKEIDRLLKKEYKILEIRRGTPVEDMGLVDIVIFANGNVELGPLLILGKSRIDQMLYDNFIYQIQKTKMFIHTKKIKHFIYIISNSAYEAFPNNTVYGATKAGLLHFARALWKEVGKDGIKVTTISPGTVDTDSFWKKAGQDNRQYCYPLDPKEIARCVKFALECDGNILELVILPRPK